MLSKSLRSLGTKITAQIGLKKALAGMFGLSQKIPMAPLEVFDKEVFEIVKLEEDR